ncbi:multidrug efflux system subunit MdtA [compost metagenome]
MWVYDAATSTVKSQVVQIATADGNEAVVAAGLTPGMQVVATGVHVLSPGQKVLIYQPKVASAPAGKAQTAINPVAMPDAPAAPVAPVVPAATAAAPAASTAN